MKDVPFRTVYIHALIRDERGQKMSKSKGNIIDPLELIDQYGADAVRFTMAAMAAQGRDIKVSLNRVEGYRNFATKLWNAARFAEFNGCARDPSFDPRKAKEVLNRWMAHETAKAVREVTDAIEAFKFNDAAAAAYRFVWNVFCDWYVELSKPVLTGPDTAARAETRAAAAWALDEILKLLHPFMPFITEELWQVTASLVIANAAQRSSGVPDTSRVSTGSAPSPLVGEGREGGKRDSLLALTEWPKLEHLDDPAAEAEIGWVIDLITAVRSVATEMKLPAGTQIPLVLVGGSPESKARADRWAEFIKRLARLSEIGFAEAAPSGSVQLIVRGEVAALSLKGLIDVSAEHARLEKEMAKVANDIARIDAKLGNADFMKRAPEEVVDGEREKRDEAEARRIKILEALERLKGAA
jgi:valyl-tRNA synthetase